MKSLGILRQGKDSQAQSGKCVFILSFLENHFKNVKTPTLAWHGAYAYNPNCWQPEGEEIGVKVILNYKPVSRRAWDMREPVY